MIPYFNLAAIFIGSVRVNIWGLMVGLGLLTSLFLIHTRAKKVGVSTRHAIDVGLWIFLGAIIGGRLGFVGLYEPAYFALHPGEIIAIWNGGLSSIGGILGAVAVFFLYTRTMNGMRLRLADILSYAWPFGWAVGRLGCFFIHDHLGVLSQSFLAVRFPDGARFDMGLLESLGAALIAVLVYGMARRPQLRGALLAVVAMSYGVLRFILDFFRATDAWHIDVRYGGLTPAQYGSVILIVVGVVLWVRRGTTADADRYGAGVV